MTPPDAPKMTPPPVANPMGMSNASGWSSLSLMPSELIMRWTSLVVTTMSTSCLPSTLNFGSWASNFFAVQGMMETTTRSSRLQPSCSGRTFLAMEPNMACGERQLERCGIISGK